LFKGNAMPEVSAADIWKLTSSFGAAGVMLKARTWLADRQTDRQTDRKAGRQAGRRMEADLKLWGGWDDVEGQHLVGRPVHLGLAGHPVTVSKSL